MSADPFLMMAVAGALRRGDRASAEEIAGAHGLDLSEAESFAARMDQAEEAAAAADAEEAFRPFRTLEEIEAETPEIEWVQPDLMYRGGLTVLAGPEKTGKSTLAYSVIGDLVDGRLGLGRFRVRGEDEAPPKVRAIVLTEEYGPPVVIKGRRYGLGGDSTAWLTHVDAVQAELGWKDMVLAAAALADRWRAEGFTVVVLVDTLADLAGLKDENDSAEATRIVNLLRLALSPTLATVLVLHHTRKGSSGSGDDLRGSSAFAASFDVVAVFGQRDSSSDERALNVRGRVIEPYSETVAYDRGAGTYCSVHVVDGTRDLRTRTPSSTADDTRERILGALPGTAREIGDRIGRTSTTVKRYLPRMLDEGVVTRSQSAVTEEAMWDRS